MKTPHNILIETMTFNNAQAEVLEEDDQSGSGKKNLYMKGIFIQGDLRNHNGRVYPLMEINRAVQAMQKAIKEDDGVLGECDHPQELQIHLERVSHKITEMWMDGANGIGKLQILPTPCGNIIKTLIESGIKLGVSSRGSGNVDDNGKVSDFDMLTVDIVAKPSAPNAYPTPIVEAIMNRKHGHKVYEAAKMIKEDPTAQQYLKELVLKQISNLR